MYKTTTSDVDAGVRDPDLQAEVHRLTHPEDHSAHHEPKLYLVPGVDQYGDPSHLADSHPERLQHTYAGQPAASQQGDLQNKDPSVYQASEAVRQAKAVSANILENFFRGKGQP